ncbi:hypothetical protein G6F36_010883 [Rhizopus arrhizus]|nr:hypothetical protein G6F36_010883 [Rhizopus arrhizus]
MPQDNKQLQRLRAKLAAASNEIRKLQQGNALLRQQLALLPSPTSTVSPLNEYASSPTTNKCPHSPNNIVSPPSKVSKPRYNTSHYSITAIVKQFSAPTTGFKFIHLPIQRRLPLHQLRSNLRHLHINTCRILDIQYPDRHVVSLLIHYGYENELRDKLRKFHILVRDDFDPLDPENVRDPEFINALTHRKVEHARWAFLQRLGPALRRFKSPLYKTVVRFFLRSGPIDHEYLRPFDLSLPYTFRNEHILDHIQSL